MNNRIVLSIALIGIAVLIMGRLFKFLHWPGANVQILVGSVAVAAALVALAINVARGRGLKELLG